MNKQITSNFITDISKLNNKYEKLQLIKILSMFILLTNLNNITKAIEQIKKRENNK